MTEIPISQEAETNQENDKAIEVQTRLKRKEKPPLVLISSGGKLVESPTTVEILEEIDLTVIPQFRLVYELFIGLREEDFLDFPDTKGAVTSTLYTAIERLEDLMRYLDEKGA